MRKDALYLLVLFVLSAALFAVQLGKSGLLDPDEPFYSLTAKEMLAQGDPWTPRMFGGPQFEKPIFFYWVLYVSFKLFGVSEFSARLGPCLAGILTVWVVYLWGRALFRRAEPAFLSALILATSGQFIALSRTVLTDIFLCLFVTAALASFSWGLRHERRRSAAWHLFFVFCGLGFLTKGPLGLLIPLSGVVVFSLASDRRWILSRFPWAGGLVLFSVIGLPWYALMAKIHGADFLEHFFVHENIRRFFIAEHRGMDRWYFYPFVLLFGFFPWSAFVLAGLARSRRHLLLAAAFFVPFLFFMAAKSKLMSYIFPLYPAAALAAGDCAWRLVRGARFGLAPARSFLFLSFLAWGVMPLALTWGALSYAAGSRLPLTAPIAAIAGVMIPCSWLSLYWLMRRRPARSFACMAGMVCVFSTLAFSWMLPTAGPALSSKSWASEWERLQAESPRALFLASKMFVRGITYYADAKGVGVFSSHPKGDFYTPHPIRIVSDAKDFSRLEKERFPVYFLIRGKELKHLRSGLEPGLSVSVVREGPQRLLVRLDRHA